LVGLQDVDHLMFLRLIGNNTAKDLLTRLLTAGRVPNALLFAGPEGVGKKQFAFELARAFVCQSPTGVEGCGECQACRRVDAFVIPEPNDKNKDDFKKVFFGEHADVGKIVAYKRAILVDAIRDLEKAAYFRPYEANARVFVIDDADKMNDEASNALLKTLEEPAATSHIILVSSRPDSLLQTIRSRCQVVRFAPAPLGEIEAFLSSSGKFAADDARLAARLSDGSVGRTLTLDLENYRLRRAAAMAVLENAVAHRDLASLLRASEEMNDAKNKEAYEETLEILRDLIHDVWLLANGSNEDEVLNIDATAKLRDLSQDAAPCTLAAWLNEIELLREGLMVNINKKIATDALFVKMASV
jgi:DNA polymerase-3 subunit delta'